MSKFEPPKAGWTPSCWFKTSSTSTSSTGLGGHFDLTVLEQRPGLVIFRVTGKDAAKAFSNEPGGHRWQRIPPTEKRGRRQTSTITVAVLPEPTAQEVHVRPQDVDMTTCRGSGPGGQHRNNTASAVILRHLPTDIQVRVESERSQHRNRELAMGLLRARILQQREAEAQGSRAEDRKAQLGSGMRGCKRRTVRMQDDRVVDHVTKKKMKASRYLKGYVEDLMRA